MKGFVLKFLIAVCAMTASVAALAGTVEVIESFAESAFWLGGDEAVEAFAEAVFVLGPEPSPGPVEPEPDPGTVVWEVGPSATAFVQNGVLYVRGSGPVTNMPWSSVAATVEKVKISEDITAIPSGSLAGMDGLTQVNGLNLSVFNAVSAGAVKSGGFTAIAIDPSTQTGTVTFRVKTATDVDAPAAEWTAIDATGVITDPGDETAIRVTVPAETPTGFFKVLAD